MVSTNEGGWYPLRGGKNALAFAPFLGKGEAVESAALDAVSPALYALALGRSQPHLGPSILGLMPSLIWNPILWQDAEQIDSDQARDRAADLGVAALVIVD